MLYYQALTTLLGRDVIMEQGVLKPDIFASQRHLVKLDNLADPLLRIAREINFGVLAT